MLQVWSNNAGTTLAAPLTATAGTLTVADVGGFAALDAGRYELVTLESGSAREIVKVTARAGTVWTVERAQEGTTAADWPAGTTIEGRVTAGTLAGLIQTAGVPDLAALDQGGEARGPNAVNLQSGRLAQANVASGAQAVAVGFNAKAGPAPGATAIGGYALAAGIDSVAINGGAFGERAVAIGIYNATSPDSVLICGYRTIPRDDWNDALESLSAGSQAAYCTPYVDLGARPAWVSEATYRRGDIVRPTSDGAVQYRAWTDVNYDTGHCESAVATTTEPDWPGAGGDVELDDAGDAFWIGIDWSDGYLTEAVPDYLTFFPTELAFICHAHSALTGTPNISIGTEATPGLLVDAEDVIITAAPQIYRFPLANPNAGIPAGTEITIQVHSFATAGRCAGRFPLSGFFVENPNHG